MPGLSMTHVEATYLALIDFSESGLTKPAEQLLADGLALMDGEQLAAPGYLRLNFGCPRVTLDEMLTRIRTSLSKA